MAELYCTISERFRFMTSSFRSLPDFLIIGAQKAGTTSLYRHLEQHPRVLSAAKKEVHYFDNKDRHWKHGLKWYRAHFPITLKKQYKRWAYHQKVISGEASPDYLFHPLAPKRIYDLVPNVKLIVLLRDPIARAYSQYHHNVRQQREQLTFEQALDQEQERIENEIDRLLADPNYYSFNYAHYSYLCRGRYLEHLMNWYPCFPKEQVLIIRSEDFFSQPARIFHQVSNYLELPEWNLNEYSVHNGHEYPDINPDTKKRLIDYFRPHNERLYEYLGVNFGWCSL